MDGQQPTTTTDKILSDLVVAVQRQNDTLDALNKNRARAGQIESLRKEIRETLTPALQGIPEAVQALIEHHVQRLEDVVTQAMARSTGQTLAIAQVMVNQIRQGLYSHRLSQGDNDALAALSRTFDMVRHALFAQLGGRSFEEAVELAAPMEITAEETDRVEPRKKHKGESSIQFHTAGGSKVDIRLGDAKSLALGAWHYGRIGVKAAAHSATLAAGGFWLLKHFLATFGINIG